MADSDFILGSQIRISPILFLQRDGYLANDYAYLAEGSPSVGYTQTGVGSFIAVVSSQVLMTIVPNVYTGTQAEYRIVSDHGTATEAHQIITQPDVTASQTQLQIIADEVTGSESQLFITADEPTSSQVSQVITTDVYTASQVDYAIGDSFYVGSQVLLNILEEELIPTQVRISPLLHLQRNGYLANDYYLAEGSPSVGYLEAGVGSFLAVASSQVELLVQPDYRTGTQVEYRIVSDKGVASEAQLFITADNVTPSQAELVITADNVTPSQSLYQIVKDNLTSSQSLYQITGEIIIASQSQYVLTKETEIATQILQQIVADKRISSESLYEISTDFYVGTQVEPVRQTVLGSEVRYALYNTTNLRILADFKSRGTTGINWTASNTEAGDFGVNNLNNDIVEYYWRTQTGVLSAIITCDSELAQGVFLDTAALLNHNLSRGATVTMQGSNDAGFVSIGVSEEIDWTNRNLYYIADTLPLVGYRYWRFVIDDPGNADGFLRIGTVVFGESQVFANECHTDQISFSRKQFVDQVFTEGHTNVQNDRGTKRQLGLEFRDLNSGGRNYAILDDLFETYGVTHKVLWIPVPRVPERFAVFGKLQELPQQTHNYKGTTDDYVDLSVTVDESL